MEASHLALLVFSSLALIARVGLFPVRIDPGELAEQFHSMPGLALFRSGAFGCGVALVCLLLAALGVATLAGRVELVRLPWHMLRVRIRVAQLFVLVDCCDGPRCYHALRGGSRLTQLSGM